MSSETVATKNGAVHYTTFLPYFFGVCFCFLVTFFLLVVANLIPVSPMLLAVLSGLLLHRLYSNAILTQGIHWTSTTILYTGVALLGLRMDIADITAVNISAPVFIIILLFATFAVGYKVSRLLGSTKNLSFLIGGAVAVCGVAAAAAICCAMPQCKERNRELAITAAGIAILSTLVMITHPAIAFLLELTPLASGVFVGGSIHNVSQVVGAGYSISNEAGDMAVLLKMVRVSALLPIVMIVTFATRAKTMSVAKSHSIRIRTFFPPFLVVFFVLAIASCLNFIPEHITLIGNDTSRFFLVASLFAIGLKTNVFEILTVGIKPLIALIVTTLFMSAAALSAMYIFP
ncbi:YeiH family protein [Kordiimonas sp. SCSIO 12610]|uniref:YeiH family protein n=1 Tax=Kordiimonas sp. SCSIO 12610 TaxID=2829597 RepID=UPI00210A0862|nr:putative sulfate exporter family transporter [Kordiimonas sp. SCSIO 12610]UTW54634.1 putative sulfate exporter family transporter [Kordiimonas sp. SCSIO 12610]